MTDATLTGFLMYAVPRLALLVVGTVLLAGVLWWGPGPREGRWLRP